MNEYLKIALPKGRLAYQVFDLMKQAGYDIDVEKNTRKLIIEDEENKFIYMFIKPTDIVTYVSEGVCDIGVVGKDSIVEENKEIYELLDLGIGKCKMVVAGKDIGVLDNKTTINVASKYPKIASDYFKSKNMKANIVKLNGSVELGPLVGLSDVIVDIFETGSTLKANNLLVIEDIFDISCRLITNKVSYRIKYKTIRELERNLSLGGVFNAAEKSTI